MRPWRHGVRQCVRHPQLAASTAVRKLYMVISLPSSAGHQHASPTCPIWPVLRATAVHSYPSTTSEHTSPRPAEPNPSGPIVLPSRFLSLSFFLFPALSLFCGCGHLGIPHPQGPQHPWPESPRSLPSPVRGSHSTSNRCLKPCCPPLMLKLGPPAPSLRGISRDTLLTD